MAKEMKRSSGAEYSIIVHSHLGWDWVWQRPQQFMSRLSVRHPILFVEGPVPNPEIDQARYEIRRIEEYPNIHVVRMAMPGAKWFDGEWVDNERRRLVRDVILEGPLGEHFRAPIQWFYDPMAVTAFARQMGEQAIVFDCMDQLSQFKGAPEQLVIRERELATIADIVFAGGPKLGQEKRRINPNTFTHGCGVDVEHFSRARDEAPLPGDVAALPKPVLGYFGVVDERMDYDLVAQLAEAFPDGSIVFVGPWTKIDPETLPKFGNVHWLGGRDYAQLSDYSRAFDVCLVPFALNEATEYVNPTKVLEYMATGRPIVSTAIEDVALQFSDVVKIGRTPEEFVQLCRREIESPDYDAVKRGLQVSSDNTWEAVVGKMERQIEEFLNSGRTARAIAG
jgi:glycosyltransferase involved in cell wall biosynthesis